MARFRLLREVAGNSAVVPWSHDSAVTALLAIPSGRRFLAGKFDGSLSVCDIHSLETVATLEGHYERITSLCCAEDGRRAVSASNDGTLRIWQLGAWTELAVLEGHSGAVNAAALTTDETRIVSAGADGTLRVWDLQSAAGVMTLEGHLGEVTSVRMLRDGKHIISAGEDGTLRLWDLVTGKEVLKFVGHDGPVNVIRVAGNDRVVSAGADRTVRVWDLTSGRSLMTLTGHRHYVVALCVSADGSLAVSSSDPYPLEMEMPQEDLSPRLWDLQIGQLRSQLSGHTARIDALCLALNGRYAISASRDQTVRAWNLETGECLAILEVADAVRKIAVGPSGHLVCANSVGEFQSLVLEETD